MLSISNWFISIVIRESSQTVDFFEEIIYTYVDIGGITMNEFEKDPQSKVNDVPGAMAGFAFSAGFFILIFAIGVVMSAVLK